MKKIYYKSAVRSNAVHYTRLIAELEKTITKKAEQRGTATARILHQIADSVHKRSMVIIFSDMLDRVSEIDELFDALQHLKFNKHEVILFQVQDKKQEVNFEYDNKPYEFIDLETGEKVRINSNQLRKEYATQMNAYRKKIELKCLQFGIDIVDADVSLGFEQVLLPYLLKRNAMS